jgi:hypothetical protein
MIEGVQLGAKAETISELRLETRAAWLIAVSSTPEEVSDAARQRAAGEGIPLSSYRSAGRIRPAETQCALPPHDEERLAGEGALPPPRPLDETALSLQ